MRLVQLRKRGARTVRRRETTREVVGFVLRDEESREEKGKIWGIFFCEKRTQKKLSSQINKGDHHLYRPKKDDDFVLPSGELPEPGEEEEEEEEFLGFLFFSFFFVMVVLVSKM